MLVLVNMHQEDTQRVVATWNESLPGHVHPNASFAVRDVWSKSDMGAHVGSVTVEVQPQDSRMQAKSPSMSATLQE